MKELRNIISRNLSDIKTIYPENSGFEKFVHIERGDAAKPLLVFCPSNSNQLQKIILFLNEIKLGAVIFAGNTGLVSAQRAVDEAVIDLNLMDNLIAIKLENGLVFNFSKLQNISAIKKSEIWRDEFQKFIQQNNLNKKDFSNAIITAEAATPVGTINFILSAAEIEVPIDMGSIVIAGGMTIGAGIANASHGTYGLLYGKLSDLAINVKSINGNGSAREDFLNINEIKTSENQTIINSAKAQYGDSAIGTQGTFAVIYEVTVKTKPIPKQRHYFLLKLSHLRNVNKFKNNLQTEFPNQLLQFEIMNKFSTELVKKYEPTSFKNPFAAWESFDSNYLLMLQIIGEDQENLGEQIYTFIIKNSFSEDDISYASNEINNPDDFIKLRHSISGASTKYATALGTAALGNSTNHRITPDLSVPAKYIENFTDEISNFCNENNLELCLFGHIGIGSFHVHIFSSEAFTEESKTKTTEGVFEITKKHNGSCWSEHGIGTANTKLYKKYTDEKFVNEWLGYKQKYDPNNILNPRSNGFFG